MVKLSTLPTFTYTKSSGTRRITTREAKSTYHGRKILTRSTSRNIIDRRKWEDQKPPTYWPKHLKWPEDVCKALLYNTRVLRRKKGINGTTRKQRIRLLTPVPPCHGIKCPFPKKKSSNPGDLCRCTIAPYASLNNPDWFERHVQIRQTSNRGIGAFALAPLPTGAVIGEYVGELITAFPAPSSLSEHEYLFNLETDKGRIGYIDSLRVGSWTRFLNHSCRANVAFEERRVGQELRYFVEVVRDVELGEEILADYGSDYWESKRYMGGCCGCGEVGCMYSGKAKSKAKAKGKGVKKTMV